MESNIDDVPSCLPFDVGLKIASSLPDEDVCSLGSCSRFWRQICRSNLIWISLYRKRWPSSLFDDPNHHSYDSDPLIKDWKGYYGKRHKEMATTAAEVLTYLDESNSIELGDYRRVQKLLNVVHFSFMDVELFLFNKGLTVVLNLIGLQYSIESLKMPCEVVLEALERCEIDERKVKIEWTELVRRNEGCILEGQRHDGSSSLGDLAISMLNGNLEDEEEVFRVLDQQSSERLFLVRSKIFGSD